jgi:hypothetical protein
MTLTNDLSRFANSANVVTAGVTTNATSITSISVANAVVVNSGGVFSNTITVGGLTMNTTMSINILGTSNPNSFSLGSYTTNASLNTVIVGPYTIPTGNTFVVTPGSRVVII